MAHSKQAKKRVRQAEKRRLLNGPQRTHARTLVKRVLKAVADKDQLAAESAYKLATSKLDTLARKNLIAKNKASRHKSRLIALIRKTFAAAA